MKKKLQKAILFFLPVLIAVSCIIWCVQNNLTGKSKQRVLEVALFDGGLGVEFWSKIIEEFEETHPQIKVNAVSDSQIGDVIRNQIASGNPPDFVDLSDPNLSDLLPELIKDNGLSDISDVFETPAYGQDTPLKNVLEPGLLDSRKFAPYGDGKIYIAPKYYGPAGLVYNKKLFEENDWELPKTWDEFFNLGEAASEDGIALFAYPGIYPYYLETFLLSSFANHAGKESIDDIFAYKEGAFSTPAVTAVAEQFEQLGSSGYVLEESASMNYKQAQTEMINGNVLFVPTGIWVETEMYDVAGPGFEYGMIPGLSMEENEDRFVFNNVGQLFIPKGAGNLEDAKEFLRFFYSEFGMNTFAEYGNAVEPIRNGIELVKDKISPSQYEMFHLFETHTSITPDFHPQFLNSKMDVYELIYGENGAGGVLSGKLTAAQWIEKVEKGFAQINLEKGR